MRRSVTAGTTGEDREGDGEGGSERAGASDGEMEGESSGERGEFDARREGREMTGESERVGRVGFNVVLNSGVDCRPPEGERESYHLCHKKKITHQYR